VKAGRREGWKAWMREAVKVRRLEGVKSKRLEGWKAWMYSASGRLISQDQNSSKAP
jgi:hypothetical protein